MRKNTWKTHAFTATLAAMQGLALPVLAQTPAAQKYQNITYISGGIGIDEVEAMRSVVKDYNLILQFAGKKTGAFLADVDVTLEGSKGETVFAAKSNGPCLFAKLPPGHYKVNASYEGKTQNKTANVSEHRRAELYFYWPLATDQDTQDREDRKEETAAEPPRHPDCT